MLRRIFFVSLVLLVVLTGKFPLASAFPQRVSASMRTPVYRGLFPKVRLPKVNLGKGVKALASPVVKVVGVTGKVVGTAGKVAVTGGKAAVTGGKAAVTGGKAAVETYSTWRALSPKANGVPVLPRGR